VHEDDAYFGSQVDHVISEKHGGATNADNLAYACTPCNHNKGSDVGSIVLLLDSGIFCRFFNPRTDRWNHHFALGADGITIIDLSDIGAVTSRILDFNGAERILEREALREVSRYPSEEAQWRM
jgi:HNH endonuclease